MNRKLKFRQAKHRHIMGDVWHYWGYVDDHQGVFVSPLSEAQGGDGFQYTGLQDKNSVDIYEGDIIETRFADDSDLVQARGNLIHIGVVIFENAQYNMKHDGKNGCHVKLYMNGGQDMLTVVGNIHENPELL